MTIYFDLDRVLADFAKQADKYKILKKNNRINWIKMSLIGSKFWSSMEFFPDAKEFFFRILSYCRENNIQVKILSSVRLGSGKRGKIKWCKDKLLLDSKDVIIVKSAEQKADFATSDALLIDDSLENVQRFISRGGCSLRFSLWNEETLNAVINLIKGMYNGKSSFNIQ